MAFTVITDYHRHHTENQAAWCLVRTSWLRQWPTPPPIVHTSATSYKVVIIIVITISLLKSKPTPSPILLTSYKVNFLKYFCQSHQSNSLEGCKAWTWRQFTYSCFALASCDEVSNQNFNQRIISLKLPSSHSKTLNAVCAPVAPLASLVGAQKLIPLLSM